jgi:hypothetical protein
MFVQVISAPLLEVVSIRKSYYSLRFDKLTYYYLEKNKFEF